MVFEDATDIEQYIGRTSKVILIYKEKVLDVTSFLEEHPGGGEILE